MNEVSTSGTHRGSRSVSVFDVNGSSNGVPRLGETVDSLTLIAGPGMVVTSSSSLGASTTTGVNGVAKRTSWEGDVWGGTLDRSDDSDPQTQRTFTDPSTVQ